MKGTQGNMWQKGQINLASSKLAQPFQVTKSAKHRRYIFIISWPFVEFGILVLFIYQEMCILVYLNSCLTTMIIILMHLLFNVCECKAAIEIEILEFFRVSHQ